MQCTYCGRDIPDDAVWCPYCGAEQTPPDETTPPDQDAPRSKALLIAIFAALGVALIVLLIALNVKPKPKDPVAAVTPVVTATAQPSAALTPSAAPTPTPTPTPKPAAGGYILPDSTTRRLTQADVADLTWEQCCLARNEIYARHGRIFQTPQIAAYFEAQSWYHGTVPGASFDNNMLSPIEHANADFLTSYENATWGHSYY